VSCREWLVGPFATKVAQSLLMFGVLLVCVLTLLFVSLMVWSIVAFWHSDNAGPDILFAVYPRQLIIPLLIMLIAATFWASRVFHWRNPS
jgi:membrane-bound metal-dependent hydrolase YbcI (DUF457 family)